MPEKKITVTVNGKTQSAMVEPRLTLLDFLRDELNLTGTHVGCEHGVCGACTVRLDGLPVRACLTLAVQADGRRVDTVEGLAGGGALGTLQLALRRHHALQCGFCTPGILMSCSELLERVPNPSEEEVREVLAGHLCRCTGYGSIVRAVLAAAAARRGDEESSDA
jgi:2-furoyl-CoA dehydrogenase 2Fe-2S iron sulfur subunit